MAPGVCENICHGSGAEATAGRFVPENGSPLGPRLCRMHAERLGRPAKGETMIAIRELRGLTSSTSALVPSAILVMSFPFEGLITLAVG